MVAWLVGGVVVASGLLVFFQVADRSERLRRAIRASGWSEGVHWDTHGFPVEPLNTWSNLAYYLAGWVPALLDATPAALLFGIACTWLCIGSAVYHGAPTDRTQHLDHSGMYCAFAALVAYSIAPAEQHIAALMIPAGLLGAVLAPWGFPGRLNAMMGIALAVALGGAVYRGTWWMAAASMAVFGVAAYLSLHLDKRLAAQLADEAEHGVGDEPPHWLHGAWHVLTAVAIVGMYLALG